MTLFTLHGDRIDEGETERLNFLREMGDRETKIGEVMVLESPCGDIEHFVMAEDWQEAEELFARAGIVK